MFSGHIKRKKEISIKDFKNDKAVSKLFECPIIVEMSTRKISGLALNAT